MNVDVFCSTNTFRIFRDGSCAGIGLLPACRSTRSRMASSLHRHPTQGQESPFRSRTFSSTARKKITKWPYDLPLNRPENSAATKSCASGLPEHFDAFRGRCRANINGLSW